MARKSPRTDQSDQNGRSEQNDRSDQGGRVGQIAMPLAGLHFRAPGAPLPIFELLRRALPAASNDELVAHIREGDVSLDGTPRRHESRDEVSAGCRVELTCADCARAVADAVSSLALEGALRALVLCPPWPAGVLEGPASELCFEQVECRGAVAELRIQLRTEPHTEPHTEPRTEHEAPSGRQALLVLERLAAFGYPVLGDALGGGVLAAGGLRLAASACEPAASWWPTEAILLGRSPRAGGPVAAFPISQDSARILERGHPWVLHDADGGDAARYRPGALVRLETASGGDNGLALIDGEGERSARRWAAQGERVASVEARVEAALDRRKALLEGSDSDAYRLVHSEADGLPGLAIDRLGGVLRVLVHGRSALSFCEAARKAALRGLRERTAAELAAVEVVHLRRPRSAQLTCARLVAGELAPPEELHAVDGLAGETLHVARERGLRFAVDLGLGDVTRSAPGVGLFLDQRENRARLAKLARQASSASESSAGRWLNLFAHTGAFSVALLAAGAREVVSVDLSARYLRWLDGNLELNRDLGIDPGHHTGVRRDGRRFLNELAPRERFAGIVLDPPTAAAAGRRYWSIRKDLEPLIEKSLEHLEAGGWLLVARNDRAPRGPSLRAAVEAAAARVRVELTSIDPAPPGRDFPSLAGFPEGDPFRALLVRREGGA